jgi:mono/diheme cytochrome c family protein
MINGTGGTIGPNLSNPPRRARSREWIAQQIRNPKSHNPNSIMPAFPTLADRQLNDLVDYLMSLKTGPARPAPSTPNPDPSADGASPAIAAGKSMPASAELPASGKQGPSGPAAYTIGSPEHGELLYIRNCQQCHGPDGVGKVPNPGSEDGTVPPLNPIDPDMFNQDPDLFAANIDRYIQHGSMPEGSHPVLTMPAWGDTDSLSQPQIAHIEAFILSLNKVERARITNPGVRPGVFFAITAGVFALTWGIALVWWLRRGRRGIGGAESAGPENRQPGPHVVGFAIIIVIVLAVIGAALTLIFSQFVTTRPSADGPAVKTQTPVQPAEHPAGKPPAPTPSNEGR